MAGAEPRLSRGGIVISALVFILSGAATIAWCASMSSMGTMRMPGGWMMTMAWMRMPEYSWTGTASAFTGMWLPMMVAMMLPSVAPRFLRYHDAAAREGARAGVVTALAAAGYFAVWLLLGVALFPIGAGLARLTMEYPAFSRAVPLLTSLVVLAAGAQQFTPWKARQLACCRTWPSAPRGFSDACLEGTRLGRRCITCCAGPTGVLLVLGVMDMRVMAVVTAAITLERLAPRHVAAARSVGSAAIAAGLVLLAHAAGAG